MSNSSLLVVGTPAGKLVSGWSGTGRQAGRQAGTMPRSCMHACIAQTAAIVGQMALYLPYSRRHSLTHSPALCRPAAAALCALHAATLHAAPSHDICRGALRDGSSPACRPCLRGYFHVTCVQSRVCSSLLLADQPCMPVCAAHLEWSSCPSPLRPACAQLSQRSPPAGHPGRCFQTAYLCGFKVRGASRLCPAPDAARAPPACQARVQPSARLHAAPCIADSLGSATATASCPRAGRWLDGGHVGGHAGDACALGAQPAPARGAV